MFNLLRFGLALCCAALCAAPPEPPDHPQLGASPRVAAPEIVRQMRREAVLGFTSAELAEFKKLHDADTALRSAIIVNAQRIIVNAQRYASLASIVDTLDLSVDTRTLAQHGEAIRSLELREERREATERANQKTIDAIKLGVFGGLLAAFLGGVGFLIKWFYFDRKLAAVREARESEHLDKIVEQVRELMLGTRDVGGGSGAWR